MYLDYFGFAELPFDITPGVKYFCEVNNQEDVFFTVIQYLERGEWFLTLTGEVGTGKTLFCNRLLDFLDGKKETFTSIYLSGYFSDVLALYKTIGQELEAKNLEDKDSFALLNIINDYLIQEYQKGRQVVLILDEAQSCSDAILEGIRLISNLETNSHKLVQILLVGQPELEKRLNTYSLRQLKERVVANFTLERIGSFTFFKRYLKGRLRIAGYVGDLNNLFTEKVLRQFYKVSDGIPRRINMLAHRLLLETYVNRKTTCDIEIFNRVNRKLTKQSRDNWWQKLKKIWSKHEF